MVPLECRTPAGFHDQSLREVVELVDRDTGGNGRGNISKDTAKQAPAIAEGLSIIVRTRDHIPVVYRKKRRRACFRRRVL